MTEAEDTASEVAVDSTVGTDDSAGAEGVAAVVDPQPAMLRRRASKVLPFSFSSPYHDLVPVDNSTNVLLSIS